MSFESLQALLDAAAGELVTADYDSVQEIIALCGCVEKLRDASSAAGHQCIPLALNRSIELINAIVTEDHCDRAGVVDTLNKIFSAVQHALRPGSDPEKVRLPGGLMQASALQHGSAGPQPDTPFILPDYLDRDIFNEFIGDQENVLAHLEEQLLNLERAPDAELLADLRRLFHTLKGEAGVFELRQVERLCHCAEDLIDTQPGSIPVDVLFAVKDWLKECFDALRLALPVPPFSSAVLSILFQGTYERGFNAPNATDTDVYFGPDTSRRFELSPFIAPEIFEIFIEEQEHALEKMEALIVLLENGPDMEAVAGLKRIFHVLNGGSGVCGLTDIEWVCCQVEDAIEKDPAALDHACLLAVKKWLKAVFNAIKHGRPLPILEESLLATLIPSCLHVHGTSAAELAVSETIYEDAIFNDFVDEQQTVAASIEELLLKLEHEADAETIEELKRLFHTLKGEARVFGLGDIEKLCHAVEDLLEKKGIAVRIETLFGVKDFIARCFRALAGRTQPPVLPPGMLAMLAMPDIDAAHGSFTAAVVFDPFKGPVEFKIKDRQDAPADVPDQPQSCLNLLSADLDLLSDFVSEVKEHIDNIDSRLLSLENNPGDSDLLNAVFRVFHTIKGAAGFLALDEISRLSHITESLLDGARKGDILLAGASIDVIFEAVDEMKNLVGTIETAISSGAGSYPSSTTVDRLVDKIKRVLAMQPAQDRHSLFSGDTASKAAVSVPAVSEEVKHATVSIDTPTAADAFAAAFHEACRDADSADSSETVCRTDADDSNADDMLTNQTEDYDDGTEPHKTVPGQVQSVQYRAKLKESIKVDAENLDKLIDAIGELVIIEAMIRQDASVRTAASSNLLRNITQMDKITRELQTLGMSLRMIPIKATFQKMARVVRDLAKKSSKKIEFITQGEETMLDKSVVDRIGDPLIHLVRNAVDHGIESSHEVRRRCGKNPVGQIILTSFHKGGNIFVEIRDDGRGLDRSAILSKAAEKGLIREGHQISDREIYNLILLPGFSTAAKVTDVSGRGVGMDVVKRTIEDLRGNIDIQSLHGAGTTITLRLPLTLAIIDGMLVRIGPERYIIPTLSIVESVRPRVQDITTVVNKGEMVAVRDKLIPLLRLADLFNIPNVTQAIEDSIVIVVEDSGRMTGILVDELLGQQSTVIKSLGALKGLAGISGGSIMTDGSVGIILDIAGIVKLAFGDNSIEHT